MNVPLQMHAQIQRAHVILDSIEDSVLKLGVQYIELDEADHKTLRDVLSFFLEHGAKLEGRSLQVADFLGILPHQLYECTDDEFAEAG